MQLSHHSPLQKGKSQIYSVYSVILTVMDSKGLYRKKLMTEFSMPIKKQENLMLNKKRKKVI
jgi:hypothetical protein